MDAAAAAEALAAELAAAQPLVDAARTQLPFDVRPDGPQLGLVFDDIPGPGAQRTTPC